VSLGGDDFDELIIQKGVPAQPEGELPITAIVISVVVIALVVTFYLLKVRGSRKKVGEIVKFEKIGTSIKLSNV